MSVSPGSRLGPYEILGPLGAGGMGEVYRARDPRLNREVAIKILPGEFFADEERRQRFEREAKLLAALNHPNIAAVYSFEETPGSPSSSSSSSPMPAQHILVMELLEGETLRGRLAGGALPVRKAVEYAVQIVKGLAAAHEKGIVHRDLKPENLFLTKDGRVKILDFGLAKLRGADGFTAAQTNLPTAAAGTEPGVVMGTLGYMSPEQVKGQPTDQRSDLFSFGAILHEMLSGSRAFHRASAAETISAILREEPPDLSATNRNVQPGLERIVHHCLEKNPEERFYSARDLAFDLEALSSPSGAAEGAAAIPAARRLPSRRLFAGAVVAAALIGAALAILAVRRAGNRPPPVFRQLTFRRGNIWNARFGSDGKTVIYAAAWDGGPNEIQLGRSDGPDVRPFGLKTADVLAVGRSGDVAVALGSKFSGAFTRIGTLARAAETGGGAAREILENVEFADFSPDGRELAVVRVDSRRRRLEYPAGKTLFETSGWIGTPRVSPRGDRVAFLDHPVFGDDGGAVAVVDLAGKKTTLTPLFASAQGLAWSPDGSEIWFAAADVGGNRSLRAVSPSGRMRVLATGAGAFTLHDVSRDGRVLLTHDLTRVGLVARGSSDARERDLSWFDWSLLADLSEDGRTALFTESGEAGGAGYSVFVRGTDGSPAVRLGEGQAFSLSPDGRRVLAIIRPTTDQQLVVYPTGAGEPKLLSHPGLQVRDAAWLPDGRRFLMTAAGPGRPSRVYLGDVEGGAPKPVTPEGFQAARGAFLLDERRFVARGPDQKATLFSLEGGEPVPVPGISPADLIVRLDPKDKTVWVQSGREMPAHVLRLDLANGKETPLREFAPADPTGVVALFAIRTSQDGRSYAYSYARILSDLYVVEGLN
jgi:eukaryotic-like serine/threonine-protein kinase